jgi:hypothetical protein
VRLRFVDHAVDLLGLPPTPNSGLASCCPAAAGDTCCLDLLPAAFLLLRSVVAGVVSSPAVAAGSLPLAGSAWSARPSAAAA